jgi:hypothetical protein
MYNGTMGNKGLGVLRKYEEDYWQTVTKGRGFLPEGVLPNFLTDVRQVFIYDCPDGYLILRYGERKEKEFVIMLGSSSDWKALLLQQKLYDQYGRESTQRFTLQMKEPAKFEGHAVSLAEPVIRGLRPKWLSATIVVGEPGEDFSSGDETAKKDIRTFLSATNLGVPIVPDTGGKVIEKTGDQVIKKLESLLLQYRRCLAEAKDEEDVQKFLKQNPFILNPWGTIHSKYKLGKEYVCDFLIEDLLAPDFKYVLVEIEPATTVLFLRSQKRQTEFTASVHHALNQLRDWETWIYDNIAYLKQDFPEFDQAGFLLIIGRNVGLSPAQGRVITGENTRARNRTILTYDDLANQLEGMINSLRKL